MHDMVIRGGRVVDGTGAAPFAGMGDEQSHCCDVRGTSGERFSNQDEMQVKRTNRSKRQQASVPTADPTR